MGSIMHSDVLILTPPTWGNNNNNKQTNPTIFHFKSTLNCHSLSTSCYFLQNITFKSSSTEKKQMTMLWKQQLIASTASLITKVIRNKSWHIFGLYFVTNVLSGKGDVRLSKINRRFINKMKYQWLTERKGLIRWWFYRV